MFDTEVNLIRLEIKKRGFISVAQLKGINVYKEEMLPYIECENIKSVNYTNKYLKGLVSKKLFYYTNGK